MSLWLAIIWLICAAICLAVFGFCRKRMADVGQQVAEEVENSVKKILKAERDAETRLLESFTGTYLEAMHFGLPILTSDLDFAHGLCGDAALYFDPHDPHSMRHAIQRIRDDLETRQQLRQRGRARLGSMLNDWDDIANHVICLLKQLRRSCD